MIKGIRVSGFRSIKNVELEVSRINIIYGGTATGKSSLLYSLIVLKNFIKNPNQNLDSFFNLGFINLGGFDACIFNHDPKGEIKIGFSIENGEYEISLSKKGGKLEQKYKEFKMELLIPIPYPLNQNYSSTYDNEYTINWNGITSNIIPNQQTAQTQQKARELTETINSIPFTLDTIDIVPHRRGFFKPIYSPSSVSLNPTTEDEVATIIINDPNLAPKISVDLEKIMNRDFRLHTPPGTSMVYFKTTDKSNRTPLDLVNDGFGVNQLVYMLAKIHRPEIKIILIEEPEVHLNPTIVRNLVRTIISISKEEEKQFLIVTHSELFITSTLTAILENLIKPEDIKFYYTEKKGKETVFIEQKANEEGQIEGGLESFISAELEDLKVFFNIKD